MRNKIFILSIFLLLVIFGCAPHPRVTEFIAHLHPPTITVQVEFNEDLSYQWIPEGQDLKIRLRDSLEREFSALSIPIAQYSPNYYIRVNNIETGGWTQRMAITKLEVWVLRNRFKVIKVAYEQDPPARGWRWRFWRVTRSPENIAKLMARKIIKAIGPLE